MADEDQPDGCPLVRLAGGYEFGRKALGSKDAESIKALRTTFSMLEYDLGLLTGFELKEFGESGLTPPAPWRLPQEPEFILVSKNDVRVGVLLFPEVPSGTKTAPKRLVRDVEALLREHRGQVDLLVGLSPWGLWVEKAYLESGADTPDILLGSGPGVEVPGVILAEGKTFWARPHAKGKSVTRVDILDLPQGRDDFRWTENGNIRFESPALTDRFVEDINVLSAITGARAD